MAETDPQPIEPYAALAAGYDLVMAHVDYETWADYVLDLLLEHAPDTRSILELGCGTGSLALALQERADEITDAPAGFEYLATDASPEMIRVARAKARLAGRAAGNLTFEVASFTSAIAPRPVDAVLLLYDGLNYLLEEQEVTALLERVASVLRPGGVAIVDQSTPANSINNAEYFQDAGMEGAFSYVRRSTFDRVRNHHVTEFDMVIEGKAFTERHVQRAYDLEEVRALVETSPLAEVAVYDGFSTDPAGAGAERLHWVLRQPG
jgi:SAM-dependent methyltransferase